MRKLENLFEIKPQQWQSELQEIEKFLSQFGKHMPSEILREYKLLADRLNHKSLDDFENFIRYTDRGGA